MPRYHAAALGLHQPKINSASRALHSADAQEGPLKDPLDTHSQPHCVWQSHFRATRPSVNGQRYYRPVASQLGPEFHWLERPNHLRCAASKLRTADALLAPVFRSRNDQCSPARRTDPARLTASPSLHELPRRIQRQPAARTRLLDALVT